MDSTLTQLSEALSSAVEQVAASAVVIHARPRASSSGVIWQPGIVVTADHTVQFDEAHVRLPDGTEAKAAVAARDRATDLAVLRVEAASTAPRFANLDTLKPGNLALAVGRTDQGLTATMGIISTVGGPWRTWRGGLLDRFVRLDVAMYASSSGAAVADATGAVLGIASAGLSRTSAIAIPRSTVDQVVSELLTRGRVARGYLGVGLQPVPLPEHLKSKLTSQQDGGVIVLSVEPGGPAEAGGLFIGDVVLDLNGQPVTDTDEMQAALGAAAVGSAVRVTVLRGGDVRTVEVTVGERPRKG
mgnify:CR=1 FL=1